MEHLKTQYQILERRVIP